MKKFCRKYKMPELSDSLYRRYYGSLKPCIFDIETTGFANGRNTSRVIMTALLIPSGENEISVTQFLAEDPYEEDRVLRATLDFLNEQKTDFLVTYNGTSFDIPFMNRRLEALHFPFTLKMYNLDLYSWIRRNTGLPGQLSALSQKSVENFFHIGTDRIDAISGRESVRLYYEYVTSHSGMLEKVLLTHNREDVVQLYRILRRLFSDEGQSLLLHGDFHQAQANYGFPLLPDAGLSLRPKISGNKLQLSGLQHCSVEKMTAMTPDVNTRVYYREEELPFPLNASIFPDAHNPLQGEFRARTADYRITLPLESYDNALYADISGLKLQDAHREVLEQMSEYVNGYLILKEGEDLSYSAINMLAQLTAEDIEKRIRTF